MILPFIACWSTKYFLRGITIPVENNSAGANSHESSNVELATGGIDLKRNCCI